MLSETFWEVYFAQKFRGVEPPAKGPALDPAGGCAPRPLPELVRRRFAPPHSHCAVVARPNPDKFPT